MEYICKQQRCKVQRNGFTLLELIIVIAIVIILSAIAVPKFTAATDTAKIAKIQADLRTIANAAAMYEVEQGKPAVNIEDLKTEGYLEFAPEAPKGENSTEYVLKDGVVTCTFKNVPYKSNEPKGAKTTGTDGETHQ